MSSSSSSSKLPSILCDKNLGKLLRELHVRPANSTSTSTSRTTPVPQDLDQRLEKLVDGLPMLRVRDPDEEESVAHVRAVIQGLIQRVIEHDPNNSAKYQQLIHKINPPLHQQQQQQLQPVFPSPEGATHSSGRDLPLADFEALYARLSNEEKKGLAFFSSLPEGFAVSQTEFFYWFVGAVFTLETRGQRDPYLLAKLVTEGLITRHTLNNGFSYYYYTKPSVSSLVRQKHISGWFLDTKCGLGIFGHGHRHSSSVININNKFLNSYTAFNLIPENKLVILQLGSWRRKLVHHSTNYTTYNRDDYIVVDQESLHNAFMKLGRKIVILNLRGTSGIVHFPDSVSNLTFLQFLDLSACNNLESLPKGIRWLKHLTYLDLSACYLLEYIPHQITWLSNLTVLKGFIINYSDSHRSCPFSALISLDKLRKLTIRTQRMGFPTNKDLLTLRGLPKLGTLGITWVGNPNTVQIDGNLQEFPNTVKKLELQSAPHQTPSQLLELIGKQKQASQLNKLYIRGGWFREFSPDKHCFPSVKIVRLRYLHQLKVEWDQFKVSFPNLTLLEVFQCPNLTSFPCDNNGIWKK